MIRFYRHYFKQGLWWDINMGVGMSVVTVKYLCKDTILNLNGLWKDI